MAGSESWRYQGRQYYMWFGHGTKPDGDKAAFASKDPLPSLQDRIHNIGHTLGAGLPASKRRHAIARLRQADHERLDRVLTGVVHAVPLGPRLIPIRVLGTNADAPGVASFVKAGAIVRDAEDHADLRHATDLVARSALEMDLDRFQPFLIQADNHLNRTGGLDGLWRDLAPAPGPVTSPPVPARASPGTPPRLPPAGPSAPKSVGMLKGAGVLAAAAAAAAAVGLWARSNHEAAVRAAIERFELDPSKPADLAAAHAFAWARVNRSLLMGTGLPESAQDAVAQQVMRAVQSDPGLLDRAMAGDADALATIRAAVNDTPMPGFGYEVRNDDEQELVNRLLGERKTGAEIQAALEDLRASRRPPTAEERRNTPGIAVLSSPLPRIDGPWLMAGRRDTEGASVPGQVAEKLSGRSFSDFKAFRDAFWMAVATIPELLQQFSKQNQRLKKQGLAPYAPRGQSGERAGVWELHHDPEIGRGGPVYDLSTVTVVTPGQHDAIHAGRR